MRGSKIRKMKYVKARFNSTAVPLQRSILFFEAIWKFCIDCQATRAGTTPGRQASTFLGKVTVEAVIQAAMMAEGSDEHLMVRRFFDTDAWDVTRVGHELQRFIANLEHLFIPAAGSAAGCQRHGFVKYACEMMCKPHVCWINGTQRVLGGPGAVTPELLSRCLSRMANWIRLTITAVSAEFPSWQLLQALDVLSLDRHATSRTNDGQTATHFERLAAAFHLDAGLLKEEFDACSHLATKAHSRSAGGNGVDAWITAIKYLHRTKTRMDSSPLAKILHVAQCWSGLSTSRVEQNFGKIRSVVTKESRHCGADTESVEARLCCDLKDAPGAFQGEVFLEASAIWSELWPHQRASGSARTGNFSRKRSLAPSSNSERGFLHKRRAAVSAATSKLKTKSLDDAREAVVHAGATAWGPELQAKEDKLVAKAEASKYSGEHVMLRQDRLTEELAAVASAAQAKSHRDAERKQAKLKAVKSAFKRKAWPLAGMPVYICSNIARSVTEKCKRLAASKGMTLVENRAAAVIFVVPNPPLPDQLTMLVSALLGGMLVTPSGCYQVDELALVCRQLAHWKCTDVSGYLMLLQKPSQTSSRSSITLSDRQQAIGRFAAGTPT